MYVLMHIMFKDQATVELLTPALIFFQPSSVESLNMLCNHQQENVGANQEWFELSKDHVFSSSYGQMLLLSICILPRLFEL